MLPTQFGLHARFYGRQAHISQTLGVPTYTLEFAIPYVHLKKTKSLPQTQSDLVKKLSELWEISNHRSAEGSDYTIEEGCDVVSICGLNDFCYSVTGFLHPEDAPAILKKDLTRDPSPRPLHQVDATSNSQEEDDDSAQEEQDAIQEGQNESYASDSEEGDNNEPTSFLENPIIPDGKADARDHRVENPRLLFLKAWGACAEKKLGKAQHLIYELQNVVDHGVSSLHSVNDFREY